jgi:aflatoxin B1 aldehyde reductase
MHHSKLKGGCGDAVIVGASSMHHLEANLLDLDKGRLPEEVARALDAGWERCKGVASSYWH